MISLKAFNISFYQHVPSMGVYVNSVTAQFLCLILQPSLVFVIALLIAYSHVVIVALGNEFCNIPKLLSKKLIKLI